MKDYSKLVEEVKEIVVQAADYAIADDFEVFSKGSIANIVTTVDIKVQQFLEEKLLALVKDSGFFGEESDPKNADRQLCWIVDPIDGTQNFSRHLNQSAISVALRDGDDIVLGVVYNPFNKEMYWAVKGEGSYCNGKRLEVSKKPFEDSIYISAFCVYRKQYAKICTDILMEIYPQTNDFRRFGVCSLEMCYMASGKADLYFEYSLCPWDFAAASLILTEAGGVFGSPLDEYYSLSQACPLIAANNQENYDRLKAICQNHMGSVWPA